MLRLTIEVSTVVIILTSHSISRFVSLLGLCFLSLFLLLLDLSFSVNSLLSSGEVFHDLLMIWNNTIIPWVSLYFLNGKSMCRIHLEHKCYKVFKFLTEEREASFFVRTVTSPENVRPVYINFVIKLICCIVSSIEGRMTSYHNKEDNCRRKKIDHNSIVRTFKDDLRSHIPKCSQNGAHGMRSISASQRGSKAKICYFKIKILII
jgi:hypothetical protein